MEDFFEHDYSQEKLELLTRLEAINKIELQQLEVKRIIAKKKIIELAEEVSLNVSFGNKEDCSILYTDVFVPLNCKREYRNPNSNEKWNGDGRTPGWLRALENSGQHRSKFLV
jgi:DNA-binding protein H-NS